MNTRPVLISWNLTRECNLSCLHCYRDAGTKGEGELDTGEALALLEEIASAGFRVLVLSGGEPLMREDIYLIISRAAALGLRVVLGSNGILISPEVAFSLKKAGASRIGISLDSTDERIHDEFRGMNGAFRKAIEGMKNCASCGLPFQVHTTVTERNMGEVERITDLAEDLGAAAHHIFFLVLTGRAKNLSEEHLKVVEHEKLLHAILEKQKNTSIEMKPTCAPTFMRIARQKGIEMRFSRGCLAGFSYCVILPEGEVHPCPYLPIVCGNVRKTPFSQIWGSSPLFTDLRKNDLKGKCGICSYQEICGGCRARAYSATGDYLEEDTWCLYHPP